MLDWNDLRTFAEVARRGSLSGAARGLGLHQTTVARRLAAAEDALGSRLLLRSTRGVKLTPAGDRLLASLHPLVDAIDEVARRAADRASAPVRIAATDNGARVLAASLGPRLHRRGRPIEIEFVSGNLVLDLARGDADLAVRVVEPTDPALVRQRLGAIRYGLYASRGYLADTPAWRAGGTGHRVLWPSAELARGPEARWLAEHARDAAPALRASSHLTLAVAAEHGAGLCVLPTDLAGFHARLVRVRPLPEIPERPVWLVMHRDTRKDARIREVAALVATAMRASLQRRA